MNVAEGRSVSRAAFCIVVGVFGRNPGKPRDSQTVTWVRTTIRYFPLYSQNKKGPERPCVEGGLVIGQPSNAAPYQ